MLSEGWTLRQADGSALPISLPARLSVEGVYLYVSGGRNTGTFMRAGVLIFIAIQAVLASRRAAQIIRLSREATIDGLTGCMNRTAYRQQLSEAPVGGLCAPAGPGFLTALEELCRVDIKIETKNCFYNYQKGIAILM